MPHHRHRFFPSRAVLSSSTETLTEKNSLSWHCLWQGTYLPPGSPKPSMPCFTGFLHTAFKWCELHYAVCTVYCMVIIKTNWFGNFKINKKVKIQKIVTLHKKYQGSQRGMAWGSICLKTDLWKIKLCGSNCRLEDQHLTQNSNDVCSISSLPRE